MPSLSGARELYLLDRAPSSSPVAVLVPDSTGIPTIVEPEPLLVRVSYLPRDFDPSQIDSARNRLRSAECELFAPLTCPEGPPYRAGVVFHHVTYQPGVTWHDHNMTARHGAMTRRYGVTTPVSPVSWIQDERHGRLGYFLSGDSTESTLWRIFRSEVDALERKILTLAPIQLAPDLPRADFSNVSDQALRRELAAMYEEFCNRVAQQAFRDVPTKARNIVEGFITHKLRSQGRTATARLGNDLQVIKRLLDDSATRSGCGWTDLEYTLANKIRLVHGRTHPESATSPSPVRPEFALSVVQDLNELLTIWGCVT